MKKIISLCVACISWVACSNKASAPFPRIAVSLLPDATGKHALQPSARMLHALYGFSDNPGIDAQFRLVPILSTRLTSPAEYHLSNEGVTRKRNRSDNPTYRHQLIARFGDSITGAIAQYHSLYPKDSSLTRSYVYKTIADEICYLAKLKCDRSFIVVYSDLLENSNLVSFYSPCGKAMLMTTPLKVAEIFNKAYPLPQNLHSFTVIFVYTTLDNRKADMYVQIVDQVYRKILEPRGAQVVLHTTDAPINSKLYEQ